MDKLVSIIIPNFNNNSYIGECIQSCVTQDYSNIEIIVIDDSSTDDSWGKIKALAATDDRIKIYQQPSNKGSNYCRNYGIAESKGEYLVFLDSDDYFYESTVVGALAKAIAEGHDFVYGDKVELYEASGTKKFISQKPAYTKDQLIDIMNICPITSSIMLDRHFFDSIMWDENIMIHQETTLIFTALIEHDLDYKHIDAPIAMIRQHASPARKRNAHQDDRNRTRWLLDEKCLKNLQLNRKLTEKRRRYFTIMSFERCYNLLSFGSKNDARLALKMWADTDKLALLRSGGIWMNPKHIICFLCGLSFTSKLGRLYRKIKLKSHSSFRPRQPVCRE